MPGRPLGGGPPPPSLPPSRRFSASAAKIKSAIARNASARSFSRRQNGGTKQQRWLQLPSRRFSKTSRSQISSRSNSLRAAMETQAGAVIAQLIKMGTMATINQHISSDVASQVARRFGFNIIVKEAGEETAEIVVDTDPAGSLTPRPPVVTVLGHVDHGKTSLLDAIRSTKVAAGEAGGITQRIGAYTVEYGDRKITFIDTPGHEAFTEMRARGAKVTDVAILVVAADDGVMPQTIEAMNHARAAGVPIVVAVNKVDKPNANVDRVKQQLSDLGLTPEDWGGQTQFIPVSAKQKTGLDELLEMVLLNADLLELRANKNRRAQAVIIEALLDRSRGPVATVLVKNGTLRNGDVVVVGSAWGRVRAMFDDKLEAIKRAGPSIPAEIMGLVRRADQRATSSKWSPTNAMRASLPPSAASASANSAWPRRAARSRSTASWRKPKKAASKSSTSSSKPTRKAQPKLCARSSTVWSNDEVRTRVIHTGVGGINESDVMLASASNAIIIGFNIRPDATIARKAEAEGVDIRLYDVIYNAIDEVKAAMTGMLKPQEREVVLGQAEVRQIFKVSKIGTIAGCYVKSGKITRDAGVRVLRDSAIVYEGKLASLKRFKDDVREVTEGYECGMAIENFNDIKEGDVIEAFAMEQVAP